MEIKTKFEYGNKVYYLGSDIYYPHSGYIEEINCKIKSSIEIIYTIQDYLGEDLQYVKESECFASKEELSDFIRKMVDSYERI